METLPAKIETLEKVGILVNKSYKNAEIARELNLTPREAKYYVDSYKEILADRVNADPDFLDRIQENTLEALDRLDLLVREAWETYATAKNMEMINQQINLLKACGDLEDKRAKLLQLMGAKADSGMMARMNKAERVNEIVSRIIKDVVSECSHCKLEALPRLAEAFALMNKGDEGVDIIRVDDIEDAEVVEQDGEWDDGQQNALMFDVISPEVE